MTQVTPEKEIVWQIHQDDLPGISLAWVTTLEVLPSGNRVIGNCHAGPGQPLLVEIDPKTRQVVWQFDRYGDFGNNVAENLYWRSRTVGTTGPTPAFAAALYSATPLTATRSRGSLTSIPTFMHWTSRTGRWPGK